MATLLIIVIALLGACTVYSAVQSTRARRRAQQAAAGLEAATAKLKAEQALRRSPRLTVQRISPRNPTPPKKTP